MSFRNTQKLQIGTDAVRRIRGSLAAAAAIACPCVSKQMGTINLVGLSQQQQQDEFSRDAVQLVACQLKLQAILEWREWRWGLDSLLHALWSCPFFLFVAFLLSSCESSSVMHVRQ